MADHKGPGPHLFRNTAGGVVGNILEWYDFAVFGYFAPVIGSLFFPSEDKLASMISAFGVFAAGYLMRPLGGVIFGSIGDRLGRKKALQFSVIMMALPTILLGFLPTHAHIGILASLLLVLLRLVQGISVGGEFIGSVSFISEIAPPKRRGFYGSWSPFSAIGGVMLGSLAAAIVHGFLPESAVNSWGWRVPFLAGFVVAVFGLWMRKGMVESPSFEKHRASGDVEKHPVFQVIRSMPGQVFHVFALAVIMGGGFYMLFVWWPTYLTKIISTPVPHALAVNTISMLALMILTPCMGYISDRWGRRRVLMSSTAGFFILAYPLFAYSDHGVFIDALVCQLIFVILMSGIQGTISATMVEMFPTKTRFSGIAMGYNISLAVFGGTAPLISTWLIDKTGHDVTAPAYYLMAMAMVSFAAALFVRSKRGQDLP